MNSLIKKYLNSRAEISDIIQFITQIENFSSFSKNLRLNSEVYALLEYDTLLRNLKKFLPEKIYQKHIIQHALGKRDYKKELKSKTPNCTTYRVFYEDRSTSVDAFCNEIDSVGNNVYEVSVDKKIWCNCGYYEQCGMICRHIFFICTFEDIKDIDRLSISDRWLKSLESLNEQHFPNPLQNFHQEEKKEKVNEIKEENQSLEIEVPKPNIPLENNLPTISQSIKVELLPKITKESPAKNFKVAKAKGAPKKNNKRKREDTASMIEKLENELKKLKLNLPTENTSIDDEVEEESPNEESRSENESVISEEEQMEKLTQKKPKRSQKESKNEESQKKSEKIVSKKGSKKGQKKTK